MNLEKTFTNVTVAVTQSKAAFFIDGSEEFKQFIKYSDCVEDHCIYGDENTFPKEPGIYICTVEYWFQQGYNEGWIAPGESDASFKCVESRKVDISSTLAQ